MDEYPDRYEHEDDTSPEGTRIGTGPAAVSAVRVLAADDGPVGHRADDHPSRGAARPDAMSLWDDTRSAGDDDDDDDPTTAADRPEGGDDLHAWSTFTTSGPRWRDQPGGWDESAPDDASMLRDESRLEPPAPAPAPATSTTATPGLSFDPGPEPEARTDRRRRTRRRARPLPDIEVDELRAPVDADDGRAVRAVSVTPGGPERDVRTAVVIGVAFAAAALVLFALGPAAAMVLVTAIVVLCSVELFSVLQRVGYQPATLLGLVANGALVLAAYWKGETAIPLVLALTAGSTLLWYLLGVTRSEPTVNAAVSMMAVLYVGLLGSFAGLLLGFDNGVGILVGVILAVVANDTGALVAGRRFGRHPLAAAISPNKTWEGLLGGALASVVVSVIVLGAVGVHPWSIGSAAALGLVVAVFAPLGDLCESMVKRDLGLKDMGSLLPGHGGLLDRFDGLLFCLPAAYYLCRLLEVF